MRTSPILLLAVLLIIRHESSLSLSLFSSGVNTTSGFVRGSDATYKGQTVKQYLGVPFAQPPVGDLRFKRPKPVERQSATIMADSMPPACIQYLVYPFPWYDDQDGKSEDCLYLNIWVPQSLLGGLLRTKLPVMFWIYGGGFTVGSNRKPLYDGKVLAAEGGVVVVTINYRMATFGFLTSGTEEAPGNVGVYDMIEALKWVNQNIAAFGGDPNKVTLAGQSAGSIAIGLLCVTPLTKGLFHRVIMESGSPAFLFAGNGSTNIDKSQKLAKAVGCATDQDTIRDRPEKVVGCLREKDPFDLAKTLNSFHPTSARSFFPSYGNELFPTDPRLAISKGEVHDVDVLIGNNRDEGAFQITTKNPDVFGFFGEKDPRVNMSYGESMLRNIFKDFEDPDAVVRHYLGKVEENNYDRIRKEVYTAGGDYSLLCPTVYFAESYSQKGNRVNFYFFTHRPSTTPWAEWMGVVHFEEIQFVFGQPLMDTRRYTAQEVPLSRRMVDIWTNFVKYGKPGTQYLWPQYSKEKPRYVELNTKPAAQYGEGPHRSNCDFFRPYFGFD